MSGHLDGPPPGPPDPPYIPGDLGAPSAKEFARRRAGDRHMSDNPYTGLHGSDNRAAAKGWDEGFAAADERIARLLRESDVMEGEWLERTAQLVEALELIRAHARLDLSQRGIAEAERYAVIADAALAAADREAPDGGGAS